jgi:SnoaL-like protein
MAGGVYDYNYIAIPGSPPIPPELQRLRDEAAITRVLAQYAVAVDRMQFDVVGSCYHPDALEDRGRYRGPIPGFLDWLRTALAEFESTWHLIGVPRIELDGNVASVRTYCLAVHLTRATVETPPSQQLIPCVYSDRFERRDDEWRIASRVAAYEPPWTMSDGAASA